MQRLPMASSPDGLISARYAVVTKTPGRGVLTWGGGGILLFSTCEWGLQPDATCEGKNG